MSEGFLSWMVTWLLWCAITLAWLRLLRDIWRFAWRPWWRCIRWHWHRAWMDPDDPITFRHEPPEWWT